MTSHRNTNRKIPNVLGGIASHPRHSSAYRISHVARTVLVSVLLAVLVFAGTAAAAVWVDLNNTIEKRSFTLPAQAEGDEAEEPQLVDPNAGQAIDLLILGQDTRDGGNAAVSGGSEEDAGLHNADTTIVAQIAADRSYINLVSIPRDSMVDVPSCSTTNGTIPAQYYVQFNSIFANAYAYGGDLASAAGCTMNAVNSLTGLDIHEAVVVDFQGLSSMIDALGGVDICIPFDTQDTYTGLDLKQGMQHLDGTQATQYARMRHGTGTDGSDVMRTTRQQYLIKTLISEALSKNLLTNSTQLYQLARAALSSLNISDGLADATVLAGLAMSLKDLNTSHLYAQTVPIVADPMNPTARVVWADSADSVWEKLRTHQPLTAQTDNAQATGDGQTSDDADTASDPNASQQTPQEDPNAGTPQQPTPDPNTGLITTTDSYTMQEILVDPNTGGVVDPETGTITDPFTGQYIGTADQYIMYTFCRTS